MSGKLFWAQQAWLDGRWRSQVALEVNAAGHWQAITPDTPKPVYAQALSGPVLPSLVNAHSHAFQRAMAGLAEQRHAGEDDFWSWRDRMYGVALRLTPEQLAAVGAQLYLELLRGGYTQVCEFHYLQHQGDGQAYGEPLTMAWALADAARQVGMGLTMLPVLYERAGFATPVLRDDQRRFATDAPWVWRACEQINQAERPLLNAGVAVHSLRAASSASIKVLQGLVGDAAVPVHIHIAEQQQELRDCLAATGKHPVDYLCREFAPDERWHLVHATHTHPDEIKAVASSGAGVVICPGTEGNLGDGLCDLPSWLDEGVPLSLGSDSHVTRGWVEELRWLEYGQRLKLRQRNVAAQPGRQASTAERLFEACVKGSAAPAGFMQWGLQVGARADFLVLEPHASGLLGVPAQHLLDALVFASQGEVFHEVYVAGRCLMRQGRHVLQDAIAKDFEQAMLGLWESKHSVLL